MQNIKIAVLTGKRGGYGAMKPMLKLFDKSKFFDLNIIATDQHLDTKFGTTVKEIENSFSCLTKIPLKQKNDSSFERTKAMSKLTAELSKVFEKSLPDIFFLYGDRSEVLSAALAALHFNIIIAHIQGGDLTGNIDDSIRHAVTKLSHLHFVSCRDSFNRIKGMYEDEWRIKVVGDSHIDPIIQKKFCKPQIIKKKFKIRKNLIIFLMLPETLDASKDYNVLKKYIEFLLSLNFEIIAVYPCSDNGYQKIIDILKFYEDQKNFRLFKNIDSFYFLGLMNIAHIIVGNSSSGIIEAPYFSLPTINIGERQKNRSGIENVYNVNYDFENFKKIVLKILNSKIKSKFKRIYGNGKTGKNIFNAILNLKKSKGEIINKL